MPDTTPEKAVPEPEYRRGLHEHCDSDPIECGVEALQGEYDALKQKHDNLLAALATERECRVVAAEERSAWDGAEGTEPCRDCGKFNGLLWHAPDPLWKELNGRYGGLLCPRCFDARASDAGIRLTWTPVVTRRDGIPTTNWWSDPIRDRLLMGEPDPHFHDDEKAQVPQGHWGEIAQALGWPYETPYPDENRADRMEGVTYKDSGVNAEARLAAYDTPASPASPDTEEPNDG